MLPSIELPYDGSFLVAKPPEGSKEGRLYIDLRLVTAIEMRTEVPLQHARLHFNGGWIAVAIDDDSDLLATWKQERNNAGERVQP